jgi:hypothetical protein
MFPFRRRVAVTMPRLYGGEPREVIHTFADAYRQRPGTRRCRQEENHP